MIERVLTTNYHHQPTNLCSLITLRITNPLKVDLEGPIVATYTLQQLPAGAIRPNVRAVLSSPHGKKVSLIPTFPAHSSCQLFPKPYPYPLFPIPSRCTLITASLPGRWAHDKPTSPTSMPCVQSRRTVCLLRLFKTDPLRLLPRIEPGAR